MYVPTKLFLTKGAGVHKEKLTSHVPPASSSCSTQSAMGHKDGLRTTVIAAAVLIA
jgi:hypothetical protein